MNDIGRDPAQEEAEQARASFTADFAGTIKIYQVLNERWQDKTPLFLLRTVQYNRVGRTRVPKSKKKKKSSKIPITDVAEKLKLTAQPVRASDSMRISLNGIHNVKNIDEKGHKNFVPVKIKFIGNPTPHKRKPTEDQIFKTIETVLVLNPKKGAISEGIQIDLSDLEVASRVLFECEFPAAANLSPKKRQKVDQADQTALSGLWTGHWVISSPIREGEHCLDLLPEVKHENVKPPNKRALSWQTFDG